MSDRPLPNSSSQDPDWEAVARYLAGSGSAEERRVMEQVIQAHPERARLIAALGNAIAVPEPPAPTSAEVERALASVLARRGAATGAARANMVSLDAYRSRRSTAWRAAAAVIVVAGAALLWRANSSPPTSTVPETQRRFASAVGAIDSVTLMDGTRVLLGPGSGVTLAAGYGDKARELTLVGEARFDVKHDAARPFTVHTSAATFRDVGTVFSIHSDGAEGARIVVSEGAVSVQAAGDAVVTLQKGDRAAVASNGALNVQRAALTAEDTAWTAGHLLFRDAPVAQVVADVRRWYGIDLVVDPALARHHVSAEFDRQSGSDVGRVIAAMLGGGFRQAGSTLYIVPPPTGPAPK